MTTIYFTRKDGHGSFWAVWVKYSDGRITKYATSATRAVAEALAAKLNKRETR